MEAKHKRTKRPPPQKAFEAVSGDTKIGEVALTRDGITWIAGILENTAVVHIGSFATLEEAKASLEKRWPERKAITWRPTRSSQTTD
jgi:hypothetical protein